MDEQKTNITNREREGRAREREKGEAE